MGKQQSKQQPRRETVALEALRQGMALIKRGLEVHGLHLDGSTEVISRSTHKSQVWADALQVLQQRQQQEGGVAAAHDDIDELHVYSDGGSRGNPGQSAAGYVIMTADEAHVLERGGQYLGITTNNQAEYQGVKLALEAARKFQARGLHVFVDSQLVAHQLNGIYKVKNQEIWPVHEAIKELAEEFESVAFEHVKREYNQLADDEVNKILDAQTTLNT